MLIFVLKKQKNAISQLEKTLYNVIISKAWKYDIHNVHVSNSYMKQVDSIRLQFFM